MSTLEFNSQVIGYSKQLQSFAYKLTSDQDDAKDLLQETLIRAITFSDKFTDATNLKGWLHMIMKNLFINNYRRKVKTRSIIQEGVDLQRVAVAAASAPRTAESHMNEQEIRNAIKGLGADYKVPFEMYVEGYKYKEIAEHMVLPIGTVKSRIFIARQELMGRLKAFKK